MTGVAHWERTNQEYLAAVLEWIRLRLDLVALRLEADFPAAPDDAATNARVTDADVAAARAAMIAAEAVQPPPAAIILRHVMGLSVFELEILLLCAAIELDGRVAPLCGRAQSYPGRPYPTFALALSLFDEPSWDALSPERPLRRARLIEICQSATQPLTTSALRADERIVSYIKGLNYLDDRLAPLVYPLRGVDTSAPLPASQQAVVDRVMSALEVGLDTGGTPVIQLVGPDSVSKQLIAAHAASALHLNLLRLPADLLPTQAGELEMLTRLWQRESTLLPIGLYVDAHELEKTVETQAAVLNRFLARTEGVVFLDTRDVRPSADRATQVFDIAKPTPHEQQVAWSRHLEPSSNGLASHLAEQFDLNLGTIDEISQFAFLAADAEERHARVWAGCLAHTRPRLATLAQRIEPKAHWDDLVLPETELRALRQIAAQTSHRAKVYDEWGFRRRMSRGLGISALFAGPSGTGKTMAAEVLATTLRLDLYRIDLSAVVSKYIGETEKNLARLFDAAEDGGVILFFDEADALFGKRSEVKDSHDRYANIEINYLLQRMEAYRGLAILATNVKSALDHAFLRRLRFIVSFPFPGLAERKALWQKVFPAEADTSGLDHGRLAALALTGASIQNVALGAAFLAAETGAPVTMPLLFEAARTEFRKLEKPINEADFRGSGIAPVQR